MDQPSYVSPHEVPKYSHLPLKTLGITTIIAVIIVSYVFYLKNHPKTIQTQTQTQAQAQKQIQEAIQKRDASLCPQVASPFTDTKGPDAGCVSATKNMTALDTANLLIVRAIKEKNEKLCDTVEKSFKEVCIQAVRDAKNGVAKTITNPLLGR